MTAIDLTFQARGRIDFAEIHNQKHYTVITTPAADEFSHPSRFKLCSTGPLGQPGQTIDFKTTIVGMVRQKTYLDKNTGYQKTFYEPDVYINVIHSQVVYLSAPDKKSV